MGTKALKQKIKNVGRFKEILSVFFKFGFDYYIHYLNLGDKVPFYKKILPPDDKANETRPVRLRQAFEELGGAFIKLGQLLSLRPDWIPQKYCDEFAKLQDSVKPFPSEEAIETIEQELDQPLKKVFRKFEKKPLAAGSIAQVHKAVLKTGEQVAVKVKRPGIDKIVQMDIDILLYVAQLVKKKFPENIADPVEIVNEFKNYTSTELDFHIEAKNMELFAQNLQENKHVHIPKVHTQYSTEKVIVMEFLHGKKLMEYTTGKIPLVSRKAVLHHLIDATFQQVFEIGHFHADPHPGNILVLPNNVIGYLDFGLIGHFSDSMKERMVLLFFSVIEADIDGLVDALVDLGAADVEVDQEALKQDMVMRLGQFYNVSLKKLNLQKLASTIMEIARDYKLRLPSNVVLLLKAVVTIESVGESIYPRFNLVDFAKPSIRRILRKEFSVTGFQKGFLKKVRRVKRTMMVLPEQTFKFLSKLNRGEFKVEFQHRDLENLIEEMQKTSNKLVFGILCAASIVGGSLAMGFETERMIFELPVFAFAGYSLAVLFALLLVYEVVRR